MPKPRAIILQANPGNKKSEKDIESTLTKIMKKRKNIRNMAIRRA